jgi:signal transduction histidine kinase/CheY-like chemotaxis protein
MPSLRGRLFRKYVLLFSGVVSTALLGSALLDVWFSYREQRELLVRIQHEQADAAAGKISHFLKEIESQMQWTTHLPWTIGGPDARRLDALRLLRQVPAITELALLDESGREQLKVSRVAQDVIGSQVDRSAETPFVEAVKNKIYYGPVYFRDESEPYLTIALAGGRRETGMSIAEVNLKFVWDVISQVKIGKRGQAYVIDTQGRLIAHPDISLVLSHFSISPVAATPGNTGSPALPRQEIVKGIRGEQVIAAYAAVVPSGWLVVTELPLGEAYASIYASILRSAALLVAALGLSILAGLALARRMVVPIEALQSGARKIGSGDFGERISIKTGDELETLGEHFNSMASQLEESYATLERKVQERTHQLQLANLAKSRFLAVASHDLRQPLNALGLFVAQLRARLDGPDRERVVERVETAVGAMNELFDALLDISKLDAGGLAAHPVDFPVSRILGRLETTFSSAAREKNLSFRIVPSSAWIHSDPILLERVLLNLVSNAVRYTKGGGIVVGCRRRAAALQIEVWDSGPGIPADQRQSIFVEFVRLGPLEPDEKSGLGLGLAIVERLCTMLGHTITVGSTVGKGSRFAVTVPLATVRASRAAPPPNAQAAIAAFEGQLVLVIDDDTLVREGMGGLLGSWGCCVIMSASASAALASLSAQGRPPDLIIADYSLTDEKPGIDAIDVVRGAFGTEIPAIVISGEDMADERLRQVHSSGFHVLHKPLSPMTLRAVMMKFLSHGQSETSPMLSAVP